MENEKADFKETWNEFVLNYNTLVYKEAGFWKKLALYLQNITFAFMWFRKIRGKLAFSLIIFLYMAYLGGCVINLLDRPSSQFNVYSGIAVFCASLVTAVNGLLLIIGPKVQAM